MSKLLQIGAKVRGKYSDVAYRGIIREAHFKATEKLYIVQLDNPLVITRNRRSALCIDVSGTSDDTIELVETV